jgi:hypothetical protein
MTSNTGLLEPSFADLITAIEQTSDLSQQTRRHWSCSARQIARWLDRLSDISACETDLAA